MEQNIRIYYIFKKKTKLDLGLLEEKAYTWLKLILKKK